MVRRLNYILTRKIVRLPEEYTSWPECGKVLHWLHKNGCNKTSEVLYRHLPWEDSNWHSGPKTEYYAVDFNDPKDAMKFALWLGLGID